MAKTSSTTYLLKQLKKFVDSAHGFGLEAALAGSLRKQDLPVVYGLGADIAGLRGAACTNNNRVTGQITRKLVSELVEIVKQAETQANAKEGLVLQPKGLSRKAVLAELKKIHSIDQQYDDGKILCSMCTKPHPLAKKAYQMFFESNLGDSGLFPGTAQLEKEVIQTLATLLHGENAVGFIVSGGTEANLMALLAARNASKIKQPEVVLPQSAHFSFTKICNLLNLKPVYAGLDSSFKVDPSEVEKCISKNTVAIVGTAGTAELGAS